MFVLFQDKIMTILNIAIAGASGKIGKMLIETIQNTKDMSLTGALDLPSSNNIGIDAAAFLGKFSNVPIHSNLADGLTNSEYLIDFTRPEGTIKHLKYCVAHGIKMIIGTTGFKKSDKNLILEASKKIAIVFAPNMSIGINVMMKLLELAVKNLKNNYDIEIIEAHHRHKIDAPSGTALEMGELIATTLGCKFDDIAIFNRTGIISERNKSSIGFSTIRGGDIVGNHTVLFAGLGECIEITHRSSNRLTYVNGSLCAARFLVKKRIGLYNMQDVLSLN